MFRALFGPVFAAPQTCSRIHGHSLRSRDDPQFTAMREVQRLGTQAGQALFYSPGDEAMLPFEGIYVQTLGGHFAERSPGSYNAVMEQYSVERYGVDLGIPRMHCNCAIDGKLVRDATFVRWVQDETKKWYGACHIQDTIEGAHLARLGCGMRVPLDFYMNPGRGQMNTTNVPPPAAHKIANDHPGLVLSRARVSDSGHAAQQKRRATIHAVPSTSSSSASSSASPSQPPGGRKRSRSEYEEDTPSEDSQDDMHEAGVRKRRHIMSLLHRAMDETAGLTSIEMQELESLIETEYCELCKMHYLRAEFRKHVITH